MKNEYLEEIWRVREKMAARFDYDLHRMVQHLRKGQEKHGDRLVLAPHAPASQVRSTKSRQRKAPMIRR